jgi:hypothetical protein
MPDSHDWSETPAADIPAKMVNVTRGKWETAQAVREAKPRFDREENYHQIAALKSLVAQQSGPSNAGAVAAALNSWGKQELIRFNEDRYQNSGYILAMSKSGKKLMSSSRVYSSGGGQQHVETHLLNNLNDKSACRHVCKGDAIRNPSSTFTPADVGHVYLYSYHEPCWGCTDIILNFFKVFQEKKTSFTVIYTNAYNGDMSAKRMKNAGITVVKHVAVEDEDERNFFELIVALIDEDEPIEDVPHYTSPNVATPPALPPMKKQKTSESQ